jgi:hypothetical protein
MPLKDSSFFCLPDKRKKERKTHRAPTPLRSALGLAGSAYKDSAFPSRLRCGAKQGLPLHPQWRAEPTQQGMLFQALSKSILDTLHAATTVKKML